MENNDNRPITLSISNSLWNDLAAWAEDDFRSIHGQIEFLLTEDARRWKRTERNDGDNTEKDVFQ